MSIAKFYERWQGGERQWWTWTYTDYGGAMFGRVAAAIRHLRRERLMRITTKRGREVVCTEGHSLFVRQKGEHAVGSTAVRVHATLKAARADSVAAGDRVAVALCIPSPRYPLEKLEIGRASLAIDEDIMALAGAWVGDGSWNRDSRRISIDDRDADTLQFLGRFGHLCQYHKGQHGLDVTICDRQAAAWLSVAGLRGQDVKARTKRIPAWVYGCSNQAAGAFLRGYFNADGGVHGHVIEASTVSPGLARDVVCLLSRFHIVASCKPRWVNGSRRYRITICQAADLRRFSCSIGFIEGRKSAALKAAISGMPMSKRTNRDHSVLWDRVADVQYLEDADEHVYDISVPGTERFVANGCFVVHNSEQQLRTALKVITAVSNGQSLWIATCNGLAQMKPELRRRFGLGIWYFDLPTAEERAAIWQIWMAKYGIDARRAGLPGDEGWTGDEIRRCCMMADDFGVSLVEAAKFIVPQCRSAADSIDRLRTQADGSFLSASYEGEYRRNRTEPEKAPRARRFQPAEA